MRKFGRNVYARKSRQIEKGVGGWVPNDFWDFRTAFPETYPWERSHLMNLKTSSLKIMLKKDPKRRIFPRNI